MFKFWTLGNSLNNLFLKRTKVPKVFKQRNKTCLKTLGSSFSSFLHVKSFKNRLKIWFFNSCVFECQIKKYLIFRFIGRKMSKVKKFLRLDPGIKKIYKSNRMSVCRSVCLYVA